MPKRAAGDRANQVAFIAGLAHERLIAGEVGELLTRAEADGAGDDPVVATNLREVRREHDRAVRVPTPLVKEIAKATTIAKAVWADARQEDDFGKFALHLKRVIELKQQTADLIGWTTERYDALMDEFEPGAKAAEVERVFAGLKESLVELVAAIKDAPRQPDKSIRERYCARSDQEAFSRRLVEAVGLDFTAGRLDSSTHPFTTSLSPLDVRLTTRYDEHYLPMSVFGTLHEAGHALYEQGLDSAHTGTPMAQSISLGIHESQSRLWENQVGRSHGFWRHYHPQLQDTFPALADVPLDEWHFAVNTVEPSPIRVEADEVTYALHIMLRFELERKMIDGTLAVAEIPDAWNAGMERLLGITPENDTLGCLQDIHWALGIIGYFPTYALGTLYAAQFFASAQKALPDLERQIAHGELLPLRDWLRENIHRHGKRYRANELAQLVTGSSLSPAPFMEYLRGKYKPLYGLS